MSRILSDEEVSRQLADLPGWQVAGGELRKAVELPDFLCAIRCVNAVAADAEAMNHHPDIDIRWRTLHFALSTHSAGGITQLDIELAHQIDADASEAASASQP
ncbi:MAG TPA: 4a-hydroxytetrahydrobiopterin dehydratase [Actinobacteria bacterium]|nr:4a-hydroxytetrahydrobiopterin dehydratase [Actinomycetota bacterium]